MSLTEFLRRRGLSDSQIKHVEDEKVDCTTIQIMSDEDLKSFFPKYGDRVAIKEFCSRLCGSKKIGLIEKLKERLNTKETNKDKPSMTVSADSRKRSLKSTRIIEIGWLCMNKEDMTYRQVKTKAGGGTRKVSISKISVCEEVLEKAKDLFFPRGISTKGRLDDFDIKLLDYKSQECNLNLTIQQMYELSALTVLRFYIGTIYKDSSHEDNDETYIPQTVTRPSESPLSMELDDHNMPVSLPGYSRRSHRLSEIPLTRYFQDFEGEVVDYPSESLNHEVTNISYFHIDDDNLNDITTLPLNEMYPIQPRTMETLILHRGKVFDELLYAVINRQIDISVVRIEMVLPNGMTEPAEDLGGVLRDSITEFFEEFYEKCTLGTDLKVPCLRHDFQEAEWSAIGKIIVQSYLSEQYFPIQIAPIFFKSCFDTPVDGEEVLSNFLKYISLSDAALINTALDNYDDVDRNDLVEFFSNYDGKWMPTKENFKKMLEQIAREELIQKPSFVKECFTGHFKMLKGKLDLCDIHKKFEASDKNIISMLEVDDDISSDQKRVVNYLKKYIKECDQKKKSSFLRFCTGSDIANHKIRIQFNSSDGFSRLPVAHICSSIVELPTTYDNFMTFRAEFNSLFSSDIWVMDII